MDGERHESLRRARELFERAICASPGAERDRICALAEDEEMRRELEALLESDARAGGFLETGGAALAAKVADELGPAPVLEPGTRRGGYEIRRVLAIGGMGAVYEALQESPPRRVALKTLRWRAASPELSRRFRFEIEVAGRLNHPGVAQIYDAGVWQEHGEAVPWFAMELVEDARDLLSFANGRRLELEGRLQLFLQVLEAVRHGHQKGVVHRDLKPANLLVDREGRVKVIDFGVARTTGVFGSSDEAQRTRAGAVLGTLAYMGPEQLAGDLERVDTRSDVWALGAVLHELVTGRLPHPVEGRTLPERLRELQTREPERSAGLPEDLGWILSRALAPDPERRYATAAEFAGDLERLLAGEPVLAGPPGPGYYLRRWVRRNRGLAAGGAVALVTVLGGLLAVSWVQSRARRVAEANEERAREAEKLARARAADVLSLSAMQRLRELEERADELWPVTLELADAYRAWLVEAGELAGTLDTHRERLARLRKDALPVGEAGGEARRFATTEERWWHGQLTRLIEELEGFLDPERGLVTGRSPDHGLGVERRLALAREMDEVTLASGEARQRWARAIDSIADPAVCPAYGGLELVPQRGLLPVGRDPRTGLWEFAHALSGDVPERDGRGRLELDGESAIVLVLVPGGSFAMGAQGADPGAPNFDPEAHHSMGPVHRVALDPFLISKYEMTQGQWLRATGENPSHYAPDRMGTTLLHPVENVSWHAARRVLRWMGLALPTEAQWEYAARAGTTTRWWTGQERETLAGAANVADEAAARSQVPWPAIGDWPGYDDGWAAHAPVDRLRPNPFGLHSVAGNVAEWCRDSGNDYATAARAGDGLRPANDASLRVVRGGGFYNAARATSSAMRHHAAPGYRDAQLGVRPVRPVRE